MESSEIIRPVPKEQGSYRKKYIIYMRAILTLVILLLGIYNYELVIGDALTGFFLIAVVISNIVFIMLPSHMYDGIKLHYIIFLLDIILIAMGAYLLTNLNMQVFMVIFLTIFISAVSQSTKMSIAIALVANIIYIFMKSQGAGEGSDIITDNVALLNIPFIFIVALHSSYLAEKANEDISEKQKLKRANLILSDKVRNVSEEVEAVLSFSERVYDSFYEGVLIIDNAGMIRTFNNKAEMIFNVRRSKVVNMSYRHAEEIAAIKAVITELTVNNLNVIGKKVEVLNDTVIKNYEISASFIKDKTEEKIGILCTVKLLPKNHEKGDL